MNGEFAAKDTLERLTKLISSQSLPTRAREQGDRLIERLGSTVRVALLGPKGVGKTQLLGALVGRQIEASASGALVLSYGEATDWPKIGENVGPKIFPDATTEGSSPPVGITQLRLPIPILEKLQFLDVPTPDSTADQSGTINWALSSADIVLWCTQTFDPSEASYWAGVPDHLKDHSFLVLTKAGDPKERGQLHGKLEKLNEIALNEFHGLFATETSGFQSRFTADPAPGLDVADGIAELRSALSELAETGRRAVDDAALLLVERYEKPDIRTTFDLRTEEEKENEKHASLPPGTRPVVEQVKTIPPGEMSVYSDALTYLNVGCQDMLCVPEKLEDQDARGILDQCLETCEALADKFAITDGFSADYQCMQADVAWAADKMLLIAMEEGLGPATDAVTILLQIKRELETRVAA